MDELPHRPVIDLQPALGQLGYQPAQGEGPLPDPLHKPVPLRAPDRFRLVPAHLTRRHAARLPEAPHPPDHRADPYTELHRRTTPRKAALLDRSNNTFSKIDRIRFRHPILASSPANTVNHISRFARIPFSDSIRNHPALAFRFAALPPTPGTGGSAVVPTTASNNRQGRPRPSAADRRSAATAPA